MVCVVGSGWAWLKVIDITHLFYTWNHLSRYTRSKATRLLRSTHSFCHKSDAHKRKHKRAHEEYNESLHSKVKTYQNISHWINYSFYMVSWKHTHQCHETSLLTHSEALTPVLSMMPIRMTVWTVYHDYASAVKTERILYKKYILLCTYCLRKLEWRRNTLRKDYDCRDSA